MIKSIRTRLQWWYSTIYVLSISVFGCLVYWRADRDVHERATLQAVATAQYLDVGLRSGPGQRPFGPPPNWMPGGPPFGGPMPGQFPGPMPGQQNGPGPGAGQGPDAGPNGPPFRGPGGEPNGRNEGPVPERRQRPPEELGERPDDIGNRQADGRPQDGQRPSGQNPPVNGPGQMPGNGRPLLPQVPPELLNQRTMAGNEGGRGFDRPPVDRLEYIIWRPDRTILAQYVEADSDLPNVQPVNPMTMAPEVTRSPNGLQVVKSGPFGTTIVVRRQMDHDMASLHRFGMQIGAIAAGTVILGVVGGRWMSGQMVRPIQQISQTASQVTVTHLDRRIELQNLDTELVPLARVLNDTFQRLEHSFQRLNQFTADASHELRTPLAVIQSQVELALSQPRSAESYQQTLETCQRSAERMSSLVDGLLLLARSDSERMNLRLAPTDLRLIAEDAVAQFQDKALSLQIELDCVTPETEVRVSADPTFLGQVPMNLIQNALQHTPEKGTVTVQVTTDRDSAYLIVSDSGCGIAADHLPLLFDRFYRIDKARSRRDGGSGLGLAICRSLVEAHDGTITCESTPGAGSRFIVKLPLASQVVVQADRRIS
ncbi:MAG: HAMP domain-containing protein [Planctomycetaceae bacterium]|nr:HAMP domain-containing protein [Planctomycetaceae bacterium]